MSLDGAKLICLNSDDADQFDTIVAHGRTFKFGYYMDCDVVLKHPNAMGLQCTIDCDAFGRVTIENCCTDNPITLDGKCLKKMRPLLHNTEICILDKKYLWQFEGNSQAKGSQMEDIPDFTTPCKQMKKAEQPPNSEPGRMWRKPFESRLTIHSFAYCIKAGQSPEDVAIVRDENKPLNVHESIAETEPVTSKKLSPPPASVTPDFIDLNTPKVKQKPTAGKSTPLSGCKLSETVITSYSPRETGVRQEKSYAVVQSPLANTKQPATSVTDVSLGSFQHVASPLTIYNYRPSMHLIDLTTPIKRIPKASSPAQTLLKSTLKNNIPQTTTQRTPQKFNKPTQLSSTSSSESVYSVHSTDDESVIVLSDDGSSSPSPVVKTPPRTRTPQSLMKRAILSSAKKAAIAKRLLQKATPTCKNKTLQFTPKNATLVRFQSQSTPQRKSLGKLQSPAENLSAGKLPNKSIFTSTPFRGAESTPSSSRRSLASSPSSLSLGSGMKKESRTSLMLKQALSKTPTSSSTQKRKSVSCLQSPYKSSPSKVRKSVSFSQRIETKDSDIAEVVKADDSQGRNHTFSVEEDNTKNEGDIEVQISTPIKDKISSPEKEECKRSTSFEKPPSVALSPGKDPNEIAERLHTGLNVTFSPEKKEDSIVTDKQCQEDTEPQSETDKKETETKSTDLLPANKSTFDQGHTSMPQTPQSLKKSSNQTITGDRPLSSKEYSDDDFDGLDTIFKTPKARNLMILSSPKSISLQKPSSDSVELIHSTEFDLSANLDDIFKTPQSEFISSRVDVEESQTPVASTTATETLSPEDAFDMLVGRPILKKSYARKTNTPKKDATLSSLKMSNESTLPKTDIEEWIENVNESIELLECAQDEDEMLCNATTSGEVSRDPLMTSSIAENTKSTIKTKSPPKDESAMTIKEDGEEEEDNRSDVKDPLQITVTRTISPNISGIDLLDHTSESIFSETLAVSDESSHKETEKTINLVDEDDQNNETISVYQVTEANIFSPDKARREMEEAFKNFENERKVLEDKRLASTPETKKPSVSKFAARRTMGNKMELDELFDPKAIKAEIDARDVGKKDEITNEEDLTTFLSDAEYTENERKEIDSFLETLEREPEFLAEQSVKSLVSEMDNDLQAEMARQEMELAFENFEDEPEFTQERTVKTPEPQKTSVKDQRRTLGSALVSEVKLDLKEEKARHDLEVAFENFEDEPEFTQERGAKTPEPQKASVKDQRRTLGSALVSEVKLDLQAEKARHEMEVAFENFEDEPGFSQERVVKTPEPKKTSVKDQRRTLGSALVSEVKLDLKEEKARHEMEVAFENFEDEPEFTQERAVKTPEPKKTSVKDQRRTLGSALVSEVKLDLKEEKARHEMQVAFENFEDEPEFTQERVVKTPEPKKTSLKDQRRTLGSALVSEVKLDLQAEKTRHEMEVAFENFEDKPGFSQERVVKTPEPKKTSVKDQRRTLGSALVSEVKLDLQAEKARHEMELAFENFEDEPGFSQERVVKTPGPKKTSVKDQRRTLGSALVSEVKLDLKEEKARHEMEVAFENFEDEPEFTQERVVKTPEPQKTSVKDQRRTLGSALVSEVKLDLQAEKARHEMDKAFENFEDEPDFTQERAVKTPDPKKTSVKDQRRTLGSALVSEVKLDLQAEKARHEMEVAFENFEDEPEFTQERVVKTPEPKKISVKDQRRTLGSALVSEVKLDLKEEKARHEMEVAFENFEDEPEFTQERVVKTPDPKKTSVKDQRRTLGSALVSEVKLDLQAEKARHEMEVAFENFEDEPEFTQERVVKTPEPKKTSVKDQRRTLGSALVSEVKLDLQAEKARHEMDKAFENFEDEPDFTQERAVKTPDPKKTSVKDQRRTLGSALVSEVKLDLQAEKARHEMEVAFENFEDEPEFTEERAVKTPEPKKTSVKDQRRTLGSALVSEVKLDLQAEKARHEMDKAFENFEDEPDFTQERAVKTPDPKKKSVKDQRRTLGSALVSEVKLDLQAEKARHEMEKAFENFEDEPEFTEERAVKTPDPKKTSVKDQRRTLGSALVSEVKLDLQAEKARHEMEVAFENFEDEPEFTQERAVKTPEPKKTSVKDQRRTLGSALVSEVKLDLQAEKARHEMDKAFENFEDEPDFTQERAVKTPDPKKTSVKDQRRTLGSALVSEVKLDLQAEKARHEMEVAFENFEDEPEFTQERAVKTPEPKKTSVNDQRRTLGSALVSEVKLDLQAEKALHEMEVAFENFEEEGATVALQRRVKTPEINRQKRTMRLSLGYRKELNQSFDLQSLKSKIEDKHKEEEINTVNESRSAFEIISEDLSCDTEAARKITESASIDFKNEEGIATKDEEKVELNKFQNTIHEQRETEELECSAKTRQKRKLRPKSVEAPEAANLSLIKTQERSTRLRRTRQNSADFIETRRYSSDVEEPAIVAFNSSKVILSSIDVNESDGPGNSEEVKVHVSTVQIDTTDVDSTEDETKLKSTKTRSKRLRKVASKSSVVAKSEEGLQHPLEPIAEEEKRHSIESSVKEVHSEIKPTDPAASAQDTQEVVEMTEKQPTLSLKAESDEIMTPDSSAIRGRRAHLKVALVESRASDETSVDILNEDRKTQKDVSVVQVPEELMVEDSEESIPSTPAPSKTRRRPSRNVESSQVIPALRRTRRGSSRDAIVENSQNEEEDVAVATERGYGRTNSKTETANNSTPARKKTQEVETPPEESPQTVETLIATEKPPILAQPPKLDVEKDQTTVEEVQIVVSKVEIAAEEVQYSNEGATTSSLATNNEDSSLIKDDIELAIENKADDEEVVPSTPIHPILRRRQPISKQKHLTLSQETSECMPASAKTPESENSSSELVDTREKSTEGSINEPTLDSKEPVDATDVLAQDCVTQRQEKGEVNVDKINGGNGEPSTSAPLKTHGRTPSIKQESATSGSETIDVLPQDSVTQEQVQVKDDAKVDETKAGNVEPSTPVAKKTRVRRPSVKQESVTAARKGTRRKAVEVVPQELDQANAKAFESAEMPQPTSETDSCGSETIDAEDNCAEASVAEQTAAIIATEFILNATPIQNDQGEEENVKNILISTSESEAIDVLPQDSVIPQAQVQEKDDAQVDEVNAGKVEPSTPVPMKTRVRRPSVKQESATAVRKGTRSKAVEVIPSTSQVSEVDSAKPASETENSGSEIVDGVDNTTEPTAIVKNVLISTSGSEAIDVLSQDSVTPQEQVQEKDDAKVDETNAGKVEPSTPVPMKTRVRRPSVKQESATPVRKGTRRKAVEVIPPTSQVPEADPAKPASETENSGSEIVDGVDNIAEPTAIVENVLISTSELEAIDVLPQDSATPQEQEQEKDDAQVDEPNTAKVEPSTPVPMKTRVRRPSVKQESATAVRKGTRSKAVEVIPPTSQIPEVDPAKPASETENSGSENVDGVDNITEPTAIVKNVLISTSGSEAIDVLPQESLTPQEQLQEKEVAQVDEPNAAKVEPSTPVPMKTRVRRPSVKQESATPVRKGTRRKAVEVIPPEVDQANATVFGPAEMPQPTSETDSCGSETIDAEDNCAEASVAEPTAAAINTTTEGISNVTPIQNDQGGEENVKNILISTSESEAIDVLPQDSVTPQEQIQEKDDAQVDEANAGNVEPSTPVPMKTRVRRPSVKQESATAVRKGTRSKAVEVIPPTSQIPEVDPAKPASETENSGSEIVDGVDNITEPTAIVKNILISTSESEAIDVLPQDSVTPQEQVQEKSDAQVDEPNAAKVEPSTLVPMKTRVRRPSVKQESATAVRKGTRRKAVEVIPSTSQVPEVDQGNTNTSTKMSSEPATTEGEVMQPTLETEMFGSKLVDAEEDPAQKQTAADVDITVEGLQNNATDVLTQNSVALGQEQENSKVDDKTDDGTVEPSTPVLPKTRGRRIVPKQESATPVRKGNRKKAVEVISTDESQQVNTDAVPSAPVTTKTRVRKAAVKEDHVSESSNFVEKREVSNESTTTGEVLLHEDDNKPEEDLNPIEILSSAKQSPTKLLESKHEALTSTDVKLSVIPKKRGRKVSVDEEHPNDQKHSNKKVIEMSSSEDEVCRNLDDVKSAEKSGAQASKEEANLNSHNKEETEVTTEVETPVPSKTRGRKAAAKKEPEVFLPENSTPAKRGGRRKVEKEDKPAAEFEVPEVVPVTPVPTKTRGRKAVVKNEQAESVSSTPVRKGGRRKATEEKVDTQISVSDVEESVIIDQNVEEIIQSTPVSKTRGRRPVPKAKAVESVESVPALKRGRRGEPDVETSLSMNTVSVKSEPITPEISTPANKRVRRGAIDDEDKSIPIKQRARRGLVKLEPETLDESTSKEEDSVQVFDSDTHEVISSKNNEPKLGSKITQTTDKVDQPILPKKRGRTAAVKSEPVASTPEHSNLADSSKGNDSDAFVEKQPIVPKKRGRPATLKSEVFESMPEANDLDAIVEKPIVSKKRGRPAAVKSETFESTPECVTPARKRGRRGAVEVEEPKEEQIPSRRMGRQAKSKVEPVSKSVTQDQTLNDTEKESTVPTPVESENEHIEKEHMKPNRRGGVVSKPTPSIAVSEEAVSEAQNKSQSMPTRGRRKGQSTKIDTTLESASHSEEDQTGSIAKASSARRAATKADTPSEEEHTQEQTKRRGRKANTKVESNQDEIEEKVNKKPTRSRKAATAETSNTSQVAMESSNAPKKATRGRQPKSSNESDHEQSLLESQTKMTLISSDTPNQVEKPAPKRALRRQNAVMTNEDPDDTPSKRVRRKPNLLLSDEYVL